MAGLGRAWDRGDSAALAAYFAADADFVDVLGRRQKGRGVIEREHRALFDTIYAGSTCVFRVIASRPLGDGVVLVHSASTLRAPSGPRRGDTFATQTMVVTAGQVTAFHNTVQTDLAGFTGEAPDSARPTPAPGPSSPPRDPTI